MRRRPGNQSIKWSSDPQPGPTELAAVAVAQNAGHMDPIISPWSTGISESTGQQLPLLQPLLYRLTLFSHSYTILINMCTQSNPPGNEWMGGRRGALLTTEVGGGPKKKGLKGLNAKSIMVVRH